jgi:hypothetical protein
MYCIGTVVAVLYSTSRQYKYISLRKISKNEMHENPNCRLIRKAHQHQLINCLGFSVLRGSLILRNIYLYSTSRSIIMLQYQYSTSHIIVNLFPPSLFFDVCCASSKSCLRIIIVTTDSCLTPSRA